MPRSADITDISSSSNTNTNTMDYGLHLMPSSKLQMPSCPVPPVPPVNPVSRHDVSSDTAYTEYKQSSFGRGIPMPKCLRFPPVRPNHMQSNRPNPPLPPVFPIRPVGGMGRYRSYDMTPSFHADLFNIEASCNVDHVVRSKLQPESQPTGNDRRGHPQAGPVHSVHSVHSPVNSGIFNHS